MQTIVIGAGASGMLAALEAAAIPGNRVRLIERQSRVGKKLSATGNGRCNLTNLHTSPESYSVHSDFVRPALELFSVADTLAYFASLGLVTVNEPDGKCYPLSDQAASVVDILRFAIDNSAVELLTGTDVESISRRGNRFHVSISDGELVCDRLILACGGPASKRLGATSDGFRFLRQLGHSVTPILPGLVQLTSDEPLLKSLKGVRAPAQLQLTDGNNTQIANSYGEVQFIENGISGPAVFELSREASRNIPCLLTLDLLPGHTADQLFRLLLDRRYFKQTSDDLLTGVLHNRLGRVISKKAGIPSAVPLSELKSETLKKCADLVKSFPLRITGTYGLEHAQITLGGADCRQFNPNTLESRLIHGLYVCGELLDVDGPCGGYNLQWAWSSGRLAGRLLHEEEEN